MRNHFSKLKLFLLMGALLGISILALSLFQNLKQKGGFLGTLGAFMDADIQIKDFSFIQTQDGFKNWEIRAAHAEVFQDQNEALLKELEVQFTLPDGLGMTFHGRQGKLDTEHHDFEISSGDRKIDINFSNGYSISTGSLRWMNQDQKILTSDPVEIKGPAFSIKGQGMEARLASQELKVLSDVHAEVF
jgi:LPS export ABC transporter protein LptC